MNRKLCLRILYKDKWVQLHKRPNFILQISLNSPVIVDARPEPRTLTAMVVEFAAIKWRFTLANPRYIGPHLFILIALSAHHRGLHGPVLIVKSSVVWLLQKVAKGGVDGVAAAIMRLTVYYLFTRYIISFNTKIAIALFYGTLGVIKYRFSQKTKIIWQNLTLDLTLNWNISSNFGAS